MKKFNAGITTTSLSRRVSAIVQAAVIVVAAFLPIIVNNNASAATLTSRKVSITSSVIGSSAQGQNVGYDFEFDFTATDVEGMIFQFCTAPLGACTKPTGMDVSNDLVAIQAGSQANFPDNVTAFAEVAANTGGCSDTGVAATVTMYCVNRTSAVSGAGTDARLNLDFVINPTSIQSIYVRISLYDNNTFSNSGGAGNILVHDGVVAAAIVDQLTVNGRVQERLDFCVAAVDDTDVLNTVASTVAACSALSDANVDLGIIDNAGIAVSPVNTTATNGSDDDYGILMVNTNALSGVVVGYYAEDQSSVSAGDTDQLKAFRVAPTNCDALATSLTDQCFASAANAADGAIITSGTELFGVYVACVDQNDGTRSTTANFTNALADNTYNGSDETVTTVADCENEAFASGTAEIGWNTAATADTLVSSTTAVDDEIVKLRFAATASPSTPSGNYTVVTTYIATSTF